MSTMISALARLRDRKRWTARPVPAAPGNAGRIAETGGVLVSTRLAGPFLEVDTGAQFGHR